MTNAIVQTIPNLNGKKLIWLMKFVKEYLVAYRRGFLGAQCNGCICLREGLQVSWIGKPNFY